MKKLTPPATTLKSDPSNSLFKYVFEYNHGHGGKEGFPKKRYSADFVSERKLFPEPIHPAIKTKYRAFLEEMKDYEILYSFYGNCFPKLTEQDGKQIICLQYNEDEEMGRIRKDIQANAALRDSVSNLARKNGVLWSKIEVIPTDKENLALSPKYTNTKKLENLNGMKACIKYWIKHLKDKGLTRIRVYDNRCIHNDNLIIEYTIPENLPERNG